MYRVTSHSPLRKKYLPVLNRGAQRKLVVGRQNNGRDHRKVKWKNHVNGSIPGSYDKNAYKLSEKNSKIHQNLSIRW
jgi:hypothetical protein